MLNKYLHYATALIGGQGLDGFGMVPDGTGTSYGPSADEVDEILSSISIVLKRKSTHNDSRVDADKRRELEILAADLANETRKIFHGATNEQRRLREGGRYLSTSAAVLKPLTKVVFDGDDPVGEAVNATLESIFDISRKPRQIRSFNAELVLREAKEENLREVFIELSSKAPLGGEQLILAADLIGLCEELYSGPASRDGVKLALQLGALLGGCLGDLMATASGVKDYDLDSHLEECITTRQEVWGGVLGALSWVGDVTCTKIDHLAEGVATSLSVRLGRPVRARDILGLRWRREISLFGVFNDLIESLSADFFYYASEPGKDEDGDRFFDGMIACYSARATTLPGRIDLSEMTLDPFLRHVFLEREWIDLWPSAGKMHHSAVLALDLMPELPTVANNNYRLLPARYLYTIRDHCDLSGLRPSADAYQTMGLLVDSLEDPSRMQIHDLLGIDSNHSIDARNFPLTKKVVEFLAGVEGMPADLKQLASTVSTSEEVTREFAFSQLALRHIGEEALTLPPKLRKMLSDAHRDRLILGASKVAESEPDRDYAGQISAYMRALEGVVRYKFARVFQASCCDLIAEGPGALDFGKLLRILAGKDEVPQGVSDALLWEEFPFVAISSKTERKELLSINEKRNKAAHPSEPQSLSNTEQLLFNDRNCLLKGNRARAGWFRIILAANPEMAREFLDTRRSNRI